MITDAERYGRLVIVRFSKKIKNKQGNNKKYWLCKCDCGNTVEVMQDYIRSGQKRSCGCLQRDVLINRSIKHGMSSKKIYMIWRGMLNRCNNKNQKYYHRYGGRGISVCERWHNFDKFYADMGERPKGKSLDRIDNDGDYCPDNCRWVSQRTQTRNTSKNIVIEFNGEKRCLADWSERLGIKYGTLWSRLNRGWDVCEALTGVRNV